MCAASFAYRDRHRRRERSRAVVSASVAVDVVAVVEGVRVMARVGGICATGSLTSLDEECKGTRTGETQGSGEQHFGSLL